MRIGVEMSRYRDLIQIRARKFLSQFGEIVIDARDRRNFIDLHAAHALGRQNFVRRVCVDDSWNENVRKSRERSTESRGVAGFGSVIELVTQRTLHLLHDPDHIDSLTSSCVLGKVSRQLAEELDVVSENLANVRPLNLDDNIARIAKFGGMNLSKARAA